MNPSDAHFTPKRSRRFLGPLFGFACLLATMTGVLALRVKGFHSFGDFPDFTYFGGNSEMRGYDYLQFVGQNFAGSTNLVGPYATGRQPLTRTQAPADSR